MDRMKQIADAARKIGDGGGGRSLDDLKRSTDILKGSESQRLRSFCTSECMEPSRDLDSFGKMLFRGRLADVEGDFSSRIQKQDGSLDVDAKKSPVVQELASMRWGPTEVPLFNLLGLFSLINPPERHSYISIARYFVKQGVLVNGTDLSGTTALSHSFSTKPAFDLEYAQILFDAGTDSEVNTRNRYGATVAHEIVQIYAFRDSEVVQRASKSLAWFLRTAVMSTSLTEMV